LQSNSTKGLGYFLTTQYINNPNLGYYDYYYSGSAYGGSDYYFLEDIPGNIQGYNGGSYCSNNNQFCDIFAPTDQQSNLYYSQYGVFWLYNWFQEENNNNMNIMNIYFLMNGNIYNYSLASVPYSFNGYEAYAIPPNSPASTINGEQIFAQSYINAYNTAFNQETTSFSGNYQKALKEYSKFNYDDVNNNFVPGTFGYNEEYNNNQGSNLGNGITIGPLQYDGDYTNVYSGAPCLFISAGSGGGSGYMYLDWIIVTYGVPYVASVS